MENVKQCHIMFPKYAKSPTNFTLHIFLATEAPSDSFDL